MRGSPLLVFTLYSTVAVVGGFRLGCRSSAKVHLSSSSPRRLLPSATTDRSLTTNSGRPRSFQVERPLIDEGYPTEGNDEEKPILLYLPGFDGTWMSVFMQLPELSTIFDVYCLRFDMGDRSTFSELKATVKEFLISKIQDDDTGETTTDADVSSTEVDDESSTESGNFFINLFQKTVNKGASSSPSTIIESSRRRKIFLAGESFGGILASSVALDLEVDDSPGSANLLDGLILINPATCYDRSRLAKIGPEVANMESNLLYPFQLLRRLVLPLLATDEFFIPAVLSTFVAEYLPSTLNTEAREAYLGRIALSLPDKLQFMPQGTLQWRLSEWLSVGCTELQEREDATPRLWSELPYSTLLVVASNDKCLPSLAEAERLSQVLTSCSVHVVEGASHATTGAMRLDLAALCRNVWGKELLVTSPDASKKDLKNKDIGRTSMSEEASSNSGYAFGMERRYDGVQGGIGLAPWLYWDPRLYRKPSS